MYYCVRTCRAKCTMDLEKEQMTSYLSYACVRNTCIFLGNGLHAIGQWKVQTERSKGISRVGVRMSYQWRVGDSPKEERAAVVMGIWNNEWRRPSPSGGTLNCVPATFLTSVITIVLYGN